VLQPKIIARRFATLFLITAFAPIAAIAQDDAPIVQPGAPGESGKEISAAEASDLAGVLYSDADVLFMQGMIMHHAQAVEMTALIKDRTKHKGITGLGARISQSQAEEIGFMKRWLVARGQKTSMQMSMSGDHKHHQMLMPGMLSAEQMEALGKSKGDEFDRLFLSGMIQHHDGALVMVYDLFENGDAGQDAELFNFATDIDSTQRAEIRIMQEMLEKVPTRKI